MDLTHPNGQPARILNRAAENDFLRRWLWSPLLGWACRLHVSDRTQQAGVTRRYAITDGSLWLIADPDAEWYRMLLDNPVVTVELPGRTLSGRAESVLDAGLATERRREIAINSGAWPEERFPARPPVVRIDFAQPLTPGVHDPGGTGWLLPHVVAPAAALLGVVRLLRRR